MLKKRTWNGEDWFCLYNSEKNMHLMQFSELTGDAVVCFKTSVSAEHYAKENGYQADIVHISTVLEEGEVCYLYDA